VKRIFSEALIHMPVTVLCTSFLCFVTGRVGGLF